MTRTVARFLLAIPVLLFMGCHHDPDAQEAFNMDAYSDEQLDELGISNREFISAASKRALRWPELGSDWFIEYEVFDLKGDLAYEEGIVRRDPSAMLKIDGKYFVWYSKSTGPTRGFGGNLLPVLPDGKVSLQCQG